MNCYECQYRKIRYNKVLVQEVYCEKYHKLIPTNLLAYNFFCWDADLKYRSEDDDSGRSIKSSKSRQGKVVLNQRNIYGDRCNKSLCSTASKRSSSKRLCNFKDRQRGKKQSQVLLSDYGKGD